MGSPIDSSRPTASRRSQRQRRNNEPNFSGLEDFGIAFVLPAGGCFRKDRELILPALLLEHGDLPDTTAVPQRPRPPAIQAPPAEPISAIDALYAPHFRRLERDLEARTGLYVPPFVSNGRVAQGSLEVTGVAEPVLVSVLEEHVPKAK